MSITSYEYTLLNREVQKHLQSGMHSPYYNLAELLQEVLQYKVTQDISPRRLYREEYEDYTQVAFKVLKDPDCDDSYPIPRCYISYCPCRSPIDPRDTFFVCVDFKSGVTQFCSRDCSLQKIKD